MNFIQTDLHLIGGFGASQVTECGNMVQQHTALNVSKDTFVQRYKLWRKAQRNMTAEKSIVAKFKCDVHNVSAYST
jgi:hypothetical protein